MILKYLETLLGDVIELAVAKGLVVKCSSHDEFMMYEGFFDLWVAELKRRKEEHEKKKALEIKKKEQRMEDAKLIQAGGVLPKEVVMPPKTTTQTPAAEQAAQDSLDVVDTKETSGTRSELAKLTPVVDPIDDPNANREWVASVKKARVAAWLKAEVLMTWMGKR